MLTFKAHIEIARSPAHFIRKLFGFGSLKMIQGTHLIPNSF